jgi:cell division protein FtsN
MINYNMKHCIYPCAGKRQQGGTLLGVIIGLVIGLAIALIVAMVITKGSTPFTNKTGKSEKTMESLIGQIIDPNKPLYGNQDPAKAAAKDLAKTVEEKQADVIQAQEAKPESDAKPKNENKQESKAQVEDKPAVDKVKKSDKPDNADEKSIYYLQVGAFRESIDAENARAKLALLGFEANVTDRVIDNGHLYRVRIGPFTQMEAANRVRGKLSENGIDVALIRNQK